MATMRMYCPSLKENVEATITDGKRVRSKGGSFRNVIYGEYEGRKCLPKTVKADVFAQHGFAAESKFDKLSKEIAEEYEEKGKSPEEAQEIGDATAAKIGRMKYGKKKFDKMGKKAEFTPEELTKSSAIHGDFDTASINYSGHQNLMMRSENESPNYEISGEVGFEELEEPEVKAVMKKYGIKIVDREAIERVEWGGIMGHGDIDYIYFQSKSLEGLEKLDDLLFDGEMKEDITTAKGAEDDYEDCQVCFTTVEKGELNDVQAGLICDTCHDMNEYAGGTGRQNNRPYSAEDEWQTNDEFWEYMYLNYGEKFNEEGHIEMTNSELRKIAKERGFDAEAVPIGNVDDDGLLAVVNDTGDHKGFIELEDDDEEESVEIEITDEEMNEIAEIKLGAETFDSENDGLMCVVCGEHFFGDECPYIGEHTQEEIDNAYNTVGSLYYAETVAFESFGGKWSKPREIEEVTVTQITPAWRYKLEYKGKEAELTQMYGYNKKMWNVEFADDSWFDKWVGKRDEYVTYRTLPREQQEQSLSDFKRLVDKYEAGDNPSRNVFESEAYDEMLNDMGVSVIQGYDASRLLRETDPIAYEVGMRDYESALLEDYQDDPTMYSEMFDEDEELTPEGERMLKEMYDNMLDESGIETLADNYNVSRLLKETDPIAYRVGLSDFESFESEGDGFNAESCEVCAEYRILDAEGYCSECQHHAEYYETRSQEDAFFSESEIIPSKISKKGKMALGLTALGLGFAMIKADKIADWFNKR